MKRLYYLDNLRVFLTMLLIVFHTSIAYGGAGSWIYEDFDKNHGITPTMVVFTIFTGVCQAFFMSLFFFISAYFTPASYERKGPVRFLKDRLIRLGIPLLAYYFGISPTTIWFVKFRKIETLSEFYQQHVFNFTWTFFGPTWFIETLLYFAIIYTMIRIFTRNTRVKGGSLTSFPSGKNLFVTAIIFGLLAFIVRLKYPTGTGILELQLGYFPLYILLMYLGIVAFRSNWLGKLPERLTRIWKWIAMCMIPVLPIGLILTGALSGKVGFNGGVNVQALFYAMWEPFVCFGMCLALLSYFQKRWNITNRLSKMLSDSAYTVYIIHPPIVVGWTMLFHNVLLPEMIKFIIVAPLSVVSCFAVSYFICKIPYAKKVL